jgi:hypothetical protein
LPRLISDLGKEFEGEGEGGELNRSPEREGEKE